MNRGASIAVPLGGCVALRVTVTLLKELPASHTYMFGCREIVQRIQHLLVTHCVPGRMVSVTCR